MRLATARRFASRVLSRYEVGLPHPSQALLSKQTIHPDAHQRVLVGPRLIQQVDYFSKLESDLLAKEALFQDFRSSQVHFRRRSERLAALQTSKQDKKLDATSGSGGGLLGSLFARKQPAQPAPTPVTE